MILDLTIKNGETHVMLKKVMSQKPVEIVTITVISDLTFEVFVEGLGFETATNPLSSWLKPQCIQSPN